MFKLINRKISQKTFIIVSLILFIFGLIYIFALYYILYLEYPQIKPFERGPVTTAPKTLYLELEQPDHDVLLFESSIIVSGKTSPFLDVLIYSDSEDTVIKADKNGNFSTVFNLDAGINQIAVDVFDTKGDRKSDTRTVYYSEEEI